MDGCGGGDDDDVVKRADGDSQGGGVSLARVSASHDVVAGGRSGAGVKCVVAGASGNGEGGGGGHVTQRVAGRVEALRSVGLRAASHDGGS